MSLRRILGYRRHDYMSNDLVLMETGLRQVTCIVRERQLRLYGHVARLLAEDPALRILSRRNPRGWTMPLLGSTPRVIRVVGEPPPLPPCVGRRGA